MIGVLWLNVVVLLGGVVAEGGISWGLLEDIGAEGGVSWELLEGIVGGVSCRDTKSCLKLISLWKHQILDVIVQKIN